MLAANVERRIGGDDPRKDRCRETEGVQRIQWEEAGEDEFAETWPLGLVLGEVGHGVDKARDHEEALHPVLAEPAEVAE